MIEGWQDARIAPRSWIGSTGLFLGLYRAIYVYRAI